VNGRLNGYGRIIKRDGNQMDVFYEEGYFKNDCLDGKGLKGDKDGNLIVQGEF